MQGSHQTVLLAPEVNSHFRERVFSTLEAVSYTKEEDKHSYMVAFKNSLV